MGGCSALNCSGSDRKGRRMFRYPKDPDRRKIWAAKASRMDAKPTMALCEAHFDENQFEHHRQDGWKKLKPNAIPTIFPKNMQSVDKRRTGSKKSGRQKQTLKVQLKGTKKSTPKRTKNETENASVEQNKRKRRIPVKRQRYDEDEYEVDWPTKRMKSTTTSLKSRQDNTTLDSTSPQSSPEKANPYEDIGMPQLIIHKTPLHSKILNKKLTPRDEHGYAMKTTKDKEEILDDPPVELVEICFNNDDVADDTENEGISCQNCARLETDKTALETEVKELRRKLSSLNSAIKIFLNPSQRETLKAVAKSFRGRQKQKDDEL